MLKLLVLSLHILVLHRKFVLLAHAPVLAEVLHAELHSLVLLAEAVRCWDLVIEVDLLLVEDEYVASRDDVARWVNQVASTVDHAAILVVKLAIGGLEDDGVAVLRHLELAQDLLHREVRHLGLPSLRQLLPLALGLSGLRGRLSGRLLNWHDAGDLTAIERLIRPVL